MTKPNGEAVVSISLAQTTQTSRIYTTFILMHAASFLPIGILEIGHALRNTNTGF